MSTLDVVRAAHEALRAAVPAFRRKAKQTEGKLASAFRDAMRLMDQQKADGVPVVERVKGLDAVLRAFWPFTREWKYLCTTCSDYGLEMLTCPGDATCGRHRQHQAHDFGKPCWCDQGKRYRQKAKPAPEDFHEAGRTKPTRMGR